MGAPPPQAAVQAKGGATKAEVHIVTPEEAAAALERLMDPLIDPTDCLVNYLAASGHVKSSRGLVVTGWPLHDEGACARLVEAFAASGLPAAAQLHVASGAVSSGGGGSRAPPPPPPSAPAALPSPPPLSLPPSPPCPAAASSAPRCTRMQMQAGLRRADAPAKHLQWRWAARCQGRTFGTLPRLPQSWAL